MRDHAPLEFIQVDPAEIEHRLVRRGKFPRIRIADANAVKSTPLGGDYPRFRILEDDTVLDTEIQARRRL